MTFSKVVISVCSAASLWASAAGAEEQTLRFKLVTSNTSSADLQLASLPDQSLTSSEAIGVALFEDGRVAFKRFVVSSAGGDDGSFIGLSTYTFQNGDALTLKFTGSWSAQGESGDYEVLSGTGAFAEATGVGRFESVDHAWQDAGLFEGSFTLEVPGT